jgi:heme A synthase
MHFPSPGVSRLAWVTAGLTLLTMAAGAVLTTDFFLTLPAATVASAGRIHEDAALLAGGMTLLLAIWLQPTNTRSWLRLIAWGAVGVVAVDAALSELQVRAALPAWQSIAHAWLAPLLVACLAAVACFTTPEWQAEPDAVDLKEWPFIPAAAKAAPVIVLLQILMGAAYRHKEWGVMPHMAGAMLVAAALLVIPVMLLQQYPNHPSLKPISIAAMSIALVQVTLGIAALVMRLLDFDADTGFIALSAAHVCVGALTLAASLVLAIEITRCNTEG